MCSFVGHTKTLTLEVSHSVLIINYDDEWLFINVAVPMLVQTKSDKLTSLAQITLIMDELHTQTAIGSNVCTYIRVLSAGSVICKTTTMLNQSEVVMKNIYSQKE